MIRKTANKVGQPLIFYHVFPFFLLEDKNDRNVTVRWEPELDDGVYINAAPLHELLPSWRDVNPKKAWQELDAGKYDWSRTAMRYWPQRVLKTCKDNKSFAIAHGLI